MSSPAGPAAAGADPTDEAARLAVFADLDATLFVGAGAGTGKTTAIVDRVVALVAGGRATVADLAAITFTEAAAAELRARVRAALEAVAAGRPWRLGAPPLPVTAAEAAARAAAAVADFDGATVTTLHGFAQALLAAHPLAAGVPPVFTVLDEPAAAALADAEWADAVAGLVADPVWAETLQRATVLGVRVDHLRALFDQLTANWDRVHDLSPSSAPPSSSSGSGGGPAGPGRLPPVDVTEVVRPLEEALAMAATCTDPQDLLLAHLQGLRPALARLQAAPDDVGRLAELRAADTLRSTKGRQANWPAGVSEVRDRCAAAQQARDDMVRRVGRRCLDDLGRWVADRALASSAARCRQGTLTFHDLLVAARQVLRHDPAVRRAVSRRFRYLLLDELQDTDPIQAELAVRITAEAPDPDAAWTELEVAAGRLFLVGDPKQAIYRFRRADVAMVDAIRLVAGDRHLELSDNWRSVPGVLHWVNAVVGPMLGAGEPGVQAAYRPLAPRRPALGAEPPVVLIGGPDGTRRPAAARRQQAMAEVAAVVSGAIGRWPVDGGRLLQADDVCVLLPSRTALPQLEGAFAAAGVEYRLDSGSLVYASAHVRDVLAVLRAVDDPADPVATLGALRSPLLACGDDDLARYAAAGGRWDSRQAPPADLPAGDRVVAAMDELRRLHEQRWWLDPGRLVALVVARTEAVVLALDERRWRDAWRRLRFLVAEAHTFCDQLGGDLRQFLAWAERRADEHARTTDLDLPAGPEGAVHVMTVHGAKGLEFPAVFLCGLDSPPAPRPPVDALFGPSGLELRVGPHQTAGYEDLDAHEADSEAAERVRLLYVATTRARDHLVVALHHDDRVRCPAADLHTASQQVPGLWRRPDADPVADPASDPAAPASAGPLGVVAGGEVADPFDDAAAVAAGRGAEVARRHRAWVDAFEVRLAAAREPTVVAATSISSRMAGDGVPAAAPGGDHGPDELDLADGFDLVDQLDLADGPDGGAVPRRRRGGAATAVGRAVHAALHTVDLAGGAGLSDAALAAAAAEGIADQHRQVARLVRAALDSPVVRRAVAGGRWWREVYVGGPVGGRTVEGFIDLLVEHDDGLEVVDYKTDLVTDDAAVDAAVDRYRHQAAAYALALRATVDRPVTRCSFVFLRRAPGDGDAGATVRTLTGDALAEAVGRVEAWLAAPADGR